MSSSDVTSNQSVGVAIAGAGRIGRLHARLIAREVPGLHVAGVTDVNVAAAEELATELGVPVFADTEQALGSPTVQALAICSATPAHVDAIVQAAQAGKAAFCEKPISTDLAEVDRALAAVNHHGTPLMVGFNRRFDPSHAAVREAARAGDVGPLTMVRITSRDPAPPPPEYVRSSGGIFVDMMIHDFDMACAIVDSPVTHVWAHGSCLIDPRIGELGDFDTALAVLLHANGVTTTIDVSRQAPYGYDQRIEVLGLAGMAASGNIPQHQAQISRASGVQGAPLQYFFLERYLDAYRRQWLAFEEYLRTAGPSPVSGEEARVPVTLALAATLSSREQRLVAVAEVQ
jgi:myo-inositol 2-dehydrogenase/D-chiro-inositol 1-dehydrogenase